MTTETPMFLRAGVLVMFTTGEYSDYGIEGMYLAMRDLTEDDAREQAQAYNDEWERQDDARSQQWEVWRVAPEPKPDPPEIMPSKHGGFVGHLISQGYLMIVDYDENHIGSYGDLSV
jgi:hypothetical protein